MNKREREMKKEKHKGYERCGCVSWMAVNVYVNASEINKCNKFMSSIGVAIANDSYLFDKFFLPSSFLSHRSYSLYCSHDFYARLLASVLFALLLAVRAPYCSVCYDRFFFSFATTSTSAVLVGSVDDSFYVHGLFSLCVYSFPTFHFRCAPLNSTWLPVVSSHRRNKNNVHSP